MLRNYKTSKKNRTNYIYYSADGQAIKIVPNEDEVTDAIIATLYEWDDAETDADHRKGHHVPVHIASSAKTSQRPPEIVNRLLIIYFAKGVSNASSNIIKSFNDLDSTQIEALNKYTGDDYVNINNSLRGLETLSADNEETVAIMKSTLSKASLTEDMTLYRGTSTEALGSLKNLSPEELIGKTFTELGFMSTSIESTVAQGTFSGNMQIEIEVSKGAHGLDISSISEYANEAEVLFNGGQEMLITGAENRGGILYINVILK